MSMFKRKQSKDKDLGEKEKDKDRHQRIAASPPISWVVSLYQSDFMKYKDRQEGWKEEEEEEEEVWYLI
jgi:hypothetical protein